MRKQRPPKKGKSARRPKVAHPPSEISEHHSIQSNQFLEGQITDLLRLTRLAEMGRLSASVAHEINNPLMVAQGFAENIELLLDRKDLPLEELRIQVLEIIKACQRISRIVTKMNRMSRSQKLRLHIVDLAEIALTSVDFMKVQLQEMDIQLDFDFDHPIPIQCDVLQIEQIILNILSNAVGAMESEESNGQRLIRISFGPAGNWHQVKIWNNGPAIPPEIQSRLMEPFYTTKEVGRGTGLGLAVSKTIMQVHGGDLTFTSSPGEGTEFILSFPIPTENPWQETAANSAGKILIIDRQVNFRRTMEEKFRLLGFQVETVSSYKEGLEKVSRRGNDYIGILMDIVPGAPEIVPTLAQIRHQRGPRCLIFTMSNFPSARDMRGDLKAAGASECFEKPLHADNFSLILRLLDYATKDAALKDAA